MRQGEQHVARDATLAEEDLDRDADDDRRRDRSGGKGRATATTARSRGSSPRRSTPRRRRAGGGRDWGRSSAWRSRRDRRPTPTRPADARGGDRGADAGDAHSSTGLRRHRYQAAAPIRPISTAARMTGSAGSPPEPLCAAALARASLAAVVRLVDGGGVPEAVVVVVDVDPLPPRTRRLRVQPRNGPARRRWARAPLSPTRAPAPPRPLPARTPPSWSSPAPTWWSRFRRPPPRHRHHRYPRLTSTPASPPDRPARTPRPATATAWWRSGRPGPGPGSASPRRRSALRSRCARPGRPGRRSKYWWRGPPPSRTSSNRGRPRC